MTHTTPPHDDPDSTPTSRDILVLLMILIQAFLLAPVILSLVSGTAAGATAPAVVMQTNNSSLNETAPYYENETAVGNSSSWLPDDVSLDGIADMAMRLGPFIIGTGDQIPGGATYSGTLITGLVMVGLFTGAVAGTSIGAAGGAVVATVAVYMLVELRFAPSWLRIVLLLIIGLVAGVAALRMTD